ncbi:MAG: hypoxanthine phosphoribosyltransferase [Planctomycetes bacterium]|nr:hypoxanthine phosphoribosyltransferase [Planctomycetota bacterium]
MRNDIARVFIPEREIATRVASKADEITAVYADNGEGITIVTILTGSLVFLADLIRCMPMLIRIALVTVSSYAGKTTEYRGARLEYAILPDLCNCDVLIVDDILDTGGTLRIVHDLVRSGRPRSVRTAVLLRKHDVAPSDFPVDFVGLISRTNS